MDLFILEEGVLRLARRIWNDVRAEEDAAEPGEANKQFRYAAYRQVRNGSDRKGAGRIAFPPPKVGVTRTLPYPTRHHSGDCSVAVPKTLAWANKEVETFVCILGEEDVVYDVYVAAAAIDIRPTTKGTVGSGNATSELSWANRSLPTAPLRSDPFRTLQWKCGIK
ncbi:unnamed protein product [Boreogadus saida]